MDETPGLGRDMSESITFIATIFDHDKLESAKIKDPLIASQVKAINAMALKNVSQIRAWKFAWLRLLTNVNIS